MTIQADHSLTDRLRHGFEIGRHPLSVTAATVSRQADMQVERLTFATQTGESVRGFFVRPASPAPCPAVLYLHAHGARYDIGADELLDGRPALVSPLGPELARRGIASLMVEMPAFGTRAEPGESARTKALLWHGRSLAGQMLGEQHAAFEWLAARDEIITERIGVFGISMGATFGYWLARRSSRALPASPMNAVTPISTR
jgi:dienelactone hydrolase